MVRENSGAIHMILNNNILLVQSDPIPEIPDPLDVMFFDPGGTAKANVSTRQTALEVANTPTVDRAYSWSVWIHASNIGTNLFRVFGVGSLTTTDYQYVLQINQQDFAGTANQKLQFNIRTNSSNAISIISTNRFLRNRWTHVCITYSGSEAASGLKMYINGLQDTTAATSMLGTYTGAMDSANNRFMVSRVDTASASTRYGGDMRDLALWYGELSSVEVAELFNEGLPIDVSTVSFYGAKIAANYPMHTNTNCLNNATFNLGSVTGITTRNIPVGLYPQMSVFNATISNTRYVAFGGLFMPNSGTYVWNGRSGTDHFVNGKIVKITMGSNMSVTSPVDIITDGTYDLRGGSVGIIDNKIMNFSARLGVSPNFIDTLRYESTDGLVGETYSAGITMAVTRPRYNFYGKVVEASVPGEFWVPQYEVDATGTVFDVNLWYRDLAGTWTKTNVWSAGTEDLGETALCRVGNTLVLLCRSEANNGLYMIYSTDNGATFSAPFATGLGTGRTMADMCLDQDGNICVIFCDRATDTCSVSMGNVLADIIADPTDWNAKSDIFKSYSTDSLGIVGYPCMIRDGLFYAVAFSAEFSSSRTDLYMGYGITGFGF